MARSARFPAVRVICTEGELGAGLHVVIEGETKVQVNARTKRRLGPGAFFGEIALPDGGSRSATVIAEMLEEVGQRLRSAEKSLSH